MTVATVQSRVRVGEMSDQQSKDTGELPRNVDDPVENGLTGIPQGIHCTATEDSGGSENDELDRIAIENFLDALAQVAISVAARRASKGQEGDS